MRLLRVVLLDKDNEEYVAKVDDELHELYKYVNDLHATKVGKQGYYVDA